MTQNEPRKPISVGAWIAIVFGALLVVALMIGCFGALFLGARSSSSLVPVAAPVPSSPTPSAPTPSAPTEK